MKTLILVRHAKSDWPEGVEDFDRPLAERGIEDAHKMSEVLSQYYRPDLLVASPARRTLTTAEIFNKVFRVELVTREKLYHPSEDNFLSTIYGLPDDAQTVALFSHNNGISNFANYLSQETLSFPTCGVAVFRVETDAWAKFDGAAKELLHFLEPKKLFRS